MNIVQEAILALEEQLPLIIKSARWSDPVLVVSGSNWYFSVLSTWRLTDESKIVVGDESVSAALSAYLV